MADDDLLSGLSIDRDESESGRGSTLLPVFTVFLAISTTVLAWMVFFGPDEAPQQSGQLVSAAEAAVTPSSPEPETVTPLPADRETPILDASGYVVAMRIATASSKTVGRIVEVLVEEGMQVEQGQVLARLDSSTQLIQLELARARLQRSQAAREEGRNRLLEGELALERTRTLTEAGLMSKELLDNAGLRVNQLMAEQDRLSAEIRVAEQEILLQQQLIEENIIRAPFAGIVVQKNAQPGEIIAPSTSGGGFTRTGICTIVDMSSLEIEVNVNESYINRIFVGQRAEAVLDAYPDFLIPAEVSAIVPTADRQRATIKVRVKFQELDSRILPDMGIKVSFYGE